MEGVGPGGAAAGWRKTSARGLDRIGGFTLALAAHDLTRLPKPLANEPGPNPRPPLGLIAGTPATRNPMLAASAACFTGLLGQVSLPGCAPQATQAA